MLATTETVTAQMESFHPSRNRETEGHQKHDRPTTASSQRGYQQFNIPQISASHSGESEEYGLLDCDAVWVGESLTFRKNTSPTCSGSKSQAVSELHDATNQLSTSSSANVQ
jgi:hypothetical protein